MSELLLGCTIVLALVLALVAVVKVHRAANLRVKQEKLEIAFTRAKQARKRGMA